MNKELKLNNKDLEEILTIAEQCRVLIPKLNYNNKLVENIFYSMKNKKELSREDIQHAHNNYLALCLIGMNECNLPAFTKLDKYMDEKYYEVNNE